MSRYHQLGRKVRDDATLLYQRSHLLSLLETGEPLPDDFEPPFVCEIDEETVGGELATLYTSPAVIATRAFLQDLEDLGLGDSLDVHDARLEDRVNGVTHDGYVLLNILGRFPCAVMDRSDHRHLGPGMDLIDAPVLDPARIPDRELFLLDEDTSCIIISDRVRDHLAARGDPDLWFGEVRLA